MSLFVYLITYAGIVIFCAAVLKRIISYINNPMHVRWELYPVPHEGGGKAEYGGSYLEEVEWWKKPRETSKINELKVMAAEIFGLKAVHEYNRPLWFVTYPFHLGLYFTIVFLVFLFPYEILSLHQLCYSDTWRRERSSLFQAVLKYFRKNNHSFLHERG